MSTRPPLHGILAEFSDPTKLVQAIHAVRRAGYRQLDAYTPFPVEAVFEALDLHRNILPVLVFFGGLTGAIAGFSLEVWTSAIDYPINVGGRPLISLPAFIPVIFECTILFAALTAVFGMIALNGLPLPYHPVFNVERFSRASTDRFFLCVEATDPKFDPASTRQFLEGLSPESVSEVEP